MGFLEFMGLRDPQRIERTDTSDFNTDLFETQVGDFWAMLQQTAGAATPALLERVWVCNRCLHMNANAISTMPLRHYGTREPAWLALPDPVWFPNGVSDAVYSIVSSLYGWGDAFVYITARYADGYPSAWTVLDPAPMTVDVVRGRRTYKSGQNRLNPENMVQITRNPGGVRGTSAIKAYASQANGLLAASDIGRVMMSAGAPNAVIKSSRKIDAAQALAIQEKWVAATASRRGAPAVLGPDLDFQPLSFSPADLMLLEGQQFDALTLATAFGIPALLVNLSVEGGLNYQTPALLMQLWWNTELRTTAGRVAQALSSNMLPAGQYVEFDPYRFLAPSFKELVDAWGVLVDKGIVSPEEARVAILSLQPEDQTEALAELATPASAGASPAQANGSVVSLRPTSSASTY